MHKRLLSLFWVCVILVTMAGFLEISRRFSNPYLLRIENQVQSLPDTDYMAAFEDCFAVKTGDIKENIFLEEIIPKGKYITKTALVPDSAKLTAGPGDFVSSGQALVRYPDGFVFSLPENGRILSVSKDKSSSSFFIRYIPAGDILLELTVSDQYLNKLSSRTPVQAWIGTEEIPARIVRISDIVKDHCFSVFVSLQDDFVTGRTGSTVKVCITAREKHNVLLIPEECVYRTQMGEAFVLVKEGEDSFEAAVQTGITDGTMTEILSGLSKTDLVLSK